MEGLTPLIKGEIPVSNLILYVETPALLAYIIRTLGSITYRSSSDDGGAPPLPQPTEPRLRRVEETHGSSFKLWRPEILLQVSDFRAYVDIL